MLDELEELALQLIHLIPMLGLFQGLFSILNTCMQLFLRLSCGLFLCDTICLFL